MFAALADALEVGLDLAVELETDASGATREGVLNDIASQLISRRMTANGQQLVIYDGSKGAQWLRWALTALGRRAGEKEGGKNWVRLALIDLCRRARRMMCDTGPQTHLLLATFVASSLDAWLPLLLVVVSSEVVVPIGTARAAADHAD